jgi:hypothetical protein
MRASRGQSAAKLPSKDYYVGPNTYHWDEQRSPPQARPRVARRER